ncbi:hypothetical protein BHE97_13670 [Aeromicrobium sp. PE09-221]|nr:hypothetical protein BHE97_13670 [Aeromicrobium sp. PE09-221]
MGTTSGTRIVAGVWDQSPFGRFCDVMVEEPSGHRTLLAPDTEIADFIAETYTFDSIDIAPVTVTVDHALWAVRHRALTLDWQIGRRRLLGGLLRTVPARLRHSESWARVIDPAARLVQPGVRTHGTAGNGRVEWYAAHDLHVLVAATGTWRGASLGTLAPLTPPVSFGFSSAPRRPSLTRVTSVIRDEDNS